MILCSVISLLKYVIMRICNYENIYIFFFCLFSLQPVRDTRGKQVQLWKELIIDYCRAQKVFIIGLEEDFPLFSNPVIESKILFLRFA